VCSRLKGLGLGFSQDLNLACRTKLYYQGLGLRDQCSGFRVLPLPTFRYQPVRIGTALGRWHVHMRAHRHNSRGKWWAGYICWLMCT
jgi:hypothetical protein